MPPLPLNITTILASSTNIVSGPTLYLGSNSSVKQTTDGFSTNYLPITTNSVLNVGTSINVNKQSDGTSKLVINSSDLRLETMYGFKLNADERPVFLL